MTKGTKMHFLEKILAFPLITKLKCSQQTASLNDVFIIEAKYITLTNEICHQDRCDHTNVMMPASSLDMLT
jgi:hypothetical protein